MAVACGGGAPPARQASQPGSAPLKVRYANIGEYLLAYECAGTGSPTVILEAGYTASGISTYGPVIVPALARRNRVCTYDRAGDGLSDARPASVRPLTGATQARELHTLLKVIGAWPPYVLVGHSYGGMITREFAALYPGQVAGMVLLDASSEREVAVYDRLHAGPWIDGTVQPAPNQTINIGAEAEPVFDGAQRAVMVDRPAAASRLAGEAKFERLFSSGGWPGLAVAGALR